MGLVLRLTLKEIVSKRILYLGLVLTLVYLVVFAVGESYSARDLNRYGNTMFTSQLGYQLMCLGWYMSALLTGTLAVIMGAGSLSHEIETGTILALVSRPLSRGSVLGGKLLAYYIVNAGYSLVLLLAISLMSQYYFKLALEPGQVMYGIAVFLLYPLVLLAITMLASACLSTLATGIISFMLFMVAVSGGFIEQIGALMHSGSLINTGIVTSLIMPVDAVYRIAITRAGGSLGQSLIADFGPFGSASVPSQWMLIYTLAYITVALILAWNRFSRRDL